MQRFERMANWLSTASALVGGAAMVLMMVQVSLDVILKHLFNHPIPTTLEMVSSYYMVAVVYLPLGIVTRDHGHIEVELFTQHLRERSLALVKAFAGLIGIGYLVILVERSTNEAIHMTAIREAWETAIWNIQVWPSRWLVPIGCGLMLIYVTIHVIDNLALFLRGKRLLAETTDEP